jgi:hypothetical protein
LSHAVDPRNAKGSLETELEPPQNPSTGSCPPRTPHDAIEKSHIETLSERKRKRIITDSGERSDDSETDTILTKKMKWLQKENETKDARLRRLKATVDKLMQQSCQEVKASMKAGTSRFLLLVLGLSQIILLGLISRHSPRINAKNCSLASAASQTPPSWLRGGCGFPFLTCEVKCGAGVLDIADPPER